MMLVTLASSLLFSAPAPAFTEDWMDRLSPASVLLLEVGDLGAALESPDPGAWLGLLKSPSIRDEIVRLVGSLSNDDDEKASSGGAAAPSAEELLKLVGAFHGLVMAVPDFQSGGALAMVHAEKGFVDLWLPWLEARGGEVFGAEIQAQEARVVAFSGEPELSILAHPEGAILLFGDLDVADRLLVHYRDVLAKQPEGESGDGWWRRCERRVEEPLFQGYVDLSRVDEGDPSEIPADQYLDVAFAGVSFGHPGEAAVSVGLYTGPDEGLQDILECFRPVDRKFLQVVPKGVYAANYLHLDFSGLVTTVLALVADFDESMADVGAGGIAALDAALGASLVDVVLPALSGDAVIATWDEPLGFESGVPQFRPDATALCMGVVDSEVLLDALEIVGEIAGWESTDGDDWTSWEFALKPGEEVILRLDADALTLGSAGRIADLEAHAADAESEPFLSDASVSALGDWEWVLTQNEATALDAIYAGYASMARASGEEPPDAAYESLRGAFISAMKALATDPHAVPMVGMTVDSSGMFAEFKAR